MERVEPAGASTGSSASSQAWLGAWVGSGDGLAPGDVLAPSAGNAASARDDDQSRIASAAGSRVVTTLGTRAGRATFRRIGESGLSSARLPRMRFG